MKRLIITTLFLITAVCSLSAKSVTVDFKIIGHVVDFMKIQETVQREINKGYTPLAITGYNNKLYFLYLSENVFPMIEWQLSRYANIEDMDNGIAEKIKAGWFPAGYTSMDSGFYILYLQSPYTATYYKVKNSKTDSVKLELEFAPFLKTGTIPMDFDIIEDNQIYLSVQMENMPASDWKQVSFDFESETLQDDIASEMTGRYIPWGFDITDGVLRISFIKFK